MQKPRRGRRAEWRRQIHVLAQSKDALDAIPRLTRGERRRRANDLWRTSTPYVRHVQPRYRHWMSKRIDSIQIGLMAIHVPRMTSE